MKTHIHRSVLLLLAGASLAFAETRMTPTEPDGVPPSRGTATGNASGTGAAGRENRDLYAPTGESSLPRAERRFLRDVSRLNEKELTLSREAAERATNADVKAFAAEMVREHEEASREFMPMSTRKGFSPDPEVRSDLQKMRQKWAEKTGGDYDKAYIETMIDAHEDTIDALENGVDSKDPDVAAYSQKMLPKVRAHLRRAEQIQKSID